MAQQRESRDIAASTAPRTRARGRTSHPPAGMAGSRRSPNEHSPSRRTLDDVVLAIRFFSRGGFQVLLLPYFRKMDDLRDAIAAALREADLELSPAAEHALLNELCALAQPKLVDAQTVADHLGVSRAWVYANSARLGARVIGVGRVRPRKRYYLHEAARALDAMKHANPQDRPKADLDVRERLGRGRILTGSTPAGHPRLRYRRARK